MENRKHQFLVFIIILLIVGFLTYFRRIINGHKFTKYGKVLYIVTMIVFVVGIMVVLYLTEVNNIISFLIGLFVATMSEHIAQLFLLIGNNFNSVLVKVIRKFTGLDFSNEIKITNQPEENKHNQK